METGTAIGLAGLVVNITQLFAQLKNSKDSDNKVEIISSVFQKQRDLYKLLMEAKEVHDILQKVWSTDTPDYEKLNSNFHELSGNDISDNLTRHVNLIGGLTKGVPLTVSKLDQKNYDANMIPVEIEKHIDRVYALYPHYEQGIEDFNHLNQQLNSYELSGSRDGLQEVIKSFGITIKGTLQLADDLILRTIPIVSYLSFEITKEI